MTYCKKRKFNLMQRNRWRSNNFFLLPFETWELHLGISRRIQIGHITLHIMQSCNQQELL